MILSCSIPVTTPYLTKFFSLLIPLPFIPNTAAQDFFVEGNKEKGYLHRVLRRLEREQWVSERLFLGLVAALVALQSPEAAEFRAPEQGWDRVSGAIHGTARRRRCHALRRCLQVLSNRLFVDGS